jgi:hypothetical protein
MLGMLPHQSSAISGNFIGNPAATGQRRFSVLSSQRKAQTRALLQVEFKKNESKAGNCFFTNWKLGTEN